MARDYDSQLLESVAVRRKRLREAVLFGPQRIRRRLDENIGKMVAGLVISAVVCAGSVGWSFLQSQLSSQEDAAQAEQQAQSPPPAAPSPPVPADWVGNDVTMDMAAAELDAAGVSPGLYVLPSEPRPQAGTATSYFLITEGERGYSAGIVEYEQGRTGTEFGTEDEAARWLYNELVLTDDRPRTLSASAEQQANEQTTKLVQQAEQQIRKGGGDSVKQTLKPGMVVDAFGQESGALLFPDGMPFAERGLPEIARAAPGSTDEAADGAAGTPEGAGVPSTGTTAVPDNNPAPQPTTSPQSPPTGDTAEDGAGQEDQDEGGRPGQAGQPEQPGSGTDGAGYHRYRVTHPFEVDASLSPSEGAAPGGGVRFTVEAGGFVQPPPLASIRWLLGNGYLERVEVTQVPA
ncbi:hypothetical protein GCM10027570_03310 [Streptomonospora sediminis]